MTYYIASALIIFSGFYLFVDAKRSIYLYLSLLALVPTGTAYADYIQKSGVLFYDWYVVFLAIYFILRKDALAITRNNLIVGALLLVVMFCVYFFYGFLANGLTKYYLKDFRPFVFMVTIFFVSLILRSVADRIKAKDFCVFVILFSGFNFIDSWLLVSGIVAGDDQFYIDNSYRYLDAGSYLSAIFLFSIFVEKNKAYADINRGIYATAIILSVGCLLLSNSRFLLLATALSIIFAVRKRVAASVLALIVAVLGAGVFYQISDQIGASRVIDGLSYDGMVFQLTTRFSPALEAIQSMGVLEFVFGKGPGFYFEIPWFYYRDLDVNNANIDSAYLTFYVKYGLFSIVFLYAFVSSMLLESELEIKLGVLVFVGLMFFVSALPYQPYLIGLGVAVPFVSILSRRCKKVPAC